MSVYRQAANWDETLQWILEGCVSRDEIASKLIYYPVGTPKAKNKKRFCFSVFNVRHEIWREKRKYFIGGNISGQTDNQKKAAIDHLHITDLLTTS